MQGLGPRTPLSTAHKAGFYLVNVVVGGSITPVYARGHSSFVKTVLRSISQSTAYT